MADHDPFDLDAAISAELDGELDAYAAELGLTADAIRGQLSTPAARARRDALAATRAALHVPVPDLDDVTRRRLLGGAAPGSEPARRTDRAWVPRVLAAAAAVALVVGGLVVFAARGSDDAAKSSSGTASGATAHGDLGNLGSVDQRKVDSLLQPAASPTAPDRAASGTAETAPGFTPDLAAATAAQVKECADQYASTGTVRFRASGSYQGRPAIVLGIDHAGRTIVFVVAAGACSDVLYSASR